MPLRGFKTGYCDAGDVPRELSDIDTPCDAVVLSVWTVTDDKTDAPIYEPMSPGQEGNASYQPKAATIYVFFGFGGEAAMQIFAGAPSDYIYAANVKDVYVRAEAGRQTRVFFTCYKNEN